MPSARGLLARPKFERIVIPTVDESWWTSTIAPYVKPRVVMLEDFYIPLPRGQYVIIPKGFDSDGGSIPLFALLAMVAVGTLISDFEWTGWSAWLRWSDWISIGLLFIGLALNPFGLMLAPFLAHDFAVRYKALIRDDGTLYRMPDVQYANRTMRRLNFATNDKIFLGYCAHAGVLIGAWMSWNRHRKNDGTSINSLRQWKRLINEDETYD